MQIRFNRQFSKQYDKAPEKIRKSFKKKLKIFTLDKRSAILNNHALKGKFRGFRSINVTGDWRALYKEYRSKDLVIFVALGTHSQLYR